MAMGMTISYNRLGISLCKYSAEVAVKPFLKKIHPRNEEEKY